MAVLSNQRRTSIREAWAKVADGVWGNLSKADQQAFVNAIDDWFDTNAATINATIPQPARGEMTQKQKARGIMLVLAERYQVL